MTLPDIVGYERQQRFLQRLTRGFERRPHAWLFVGPEQVGKRTIATWWARQLLCHMPEEAPCGECSSCQMRELAQHPDLHLLYNDDQFSIDEIRRLRSALQQSPFFSRGHVVVMDCVERLKPQAANALLKILEEPPAQTIFILVTAQPQALLGTIRSRCSILRFSILSRKELEHYLQSLDLDHPDKQQMIAASQGRIGRLMEWIRKPSTWEAEQERMKDVQAYLHLSLDQRLRFLDEQLRRKKLFSEQQAWAQQWLKDVLSTGRSEMISAKDPKHWLPGLEKAWATQEILRSTNTQPKLLLDALTVTLPS